MNLDLDQPAHTESDQGLSYIMFMTSVDWSESAEAQRLHGSHVSVSRFFIWRNFSVMLILSHAACCGGVAADGKMFVQ